MSITANKISKLHRAQMSCLVAIDDGVQICIINYISPCGILTTENTILYNENEFCLGEVSYTIRITT